MRTHPPSLAALFLPAEIDETALKSVLYRKTRRLAKAVRRDRQNAASAMCDGALAALRSALNIPLSDLMAGPWAELRELRDAAQLSASGRAYSVALGDHKLRSDHTPILDIARRGAHLAQLKARVRVEFEFERVEIVLRDGAIVALREGLYDGKGALSIEGATVAMLPKERFEIGREARLHKPIGLS